MLKQLPFTLSRNGHILEVVVIYYNLEILGIFLRLCRCKYDIELVICFAIDIYACYGRCKNYLKISDALQL